MLNLASRYLLLLFLLGQSWLIHAGAPGDTLCQAPCSTDGKWELSVGLGLGVSTNPLKDGSDIPLIVRPKLSYYGERIFFDNYEAGLILWENPTQQINLLIAPSLEQLYFRRWQYASRSLSLNPESIKGDGASDSPQEAMRHLRHRHTSALGGFEYNASLSDVVDGLEFNWQFLEELSGYHSGREMRLAISRDFLTYWRASFGANFQSRDYINYYFGVDAQEENALFKEYQAERGGWSKLVRVEYLKPLNQHFAIKGSAALKLFSSEVASSPLLEESSVYSVFVGGVYYF